MNYKRISENIKTKPLLLVVLAPLLTIIVGAFFTITLLFVIHFLYPTITDLSSIQLWVQILSKLTIVLVLYYYCHKIFKFSWQYQKVSLLFVLFTLCITETWWFVEFLIKHGDYSILTYSVDLSYERTLLLLRTVIFAPILEEFLFRKWMFGYMKSKNISPFFILIFTSVLFYLWHGELHRWELILSGLIFGGFYLKGKNIIYPILCHTLFNLMSFLFHVN